MLYFSNKERGQQYSDPLCSYFEYFSAGCVSTKFPYATRHLQRLKSWTTTKIYSKKLYHTCL